LRGATQRIYAESVSPMKILSSLCLLLIIVCQIGSYPFAYSMGWLGRSMWEFFNPFITGPLILVSFLVLVITWIASLWAPKTRLWTTTMFLGFLVLAGLDWYRVLPPPGSAVVYGIRNHVMQACTLDDLRHFTHDVHRDIPNIDVFHGDASALVGDRAEAYRKLQGHYPFLNWGLGQGDGPLIQERDGALNVEWGGALPGHWGFSVTVDGGKNESETDSDTQVLRMSDDIYFYHGD
jgi:hypothetical protein